MALTFVVDSKSHTSTCGHESRLVIMYGPGLWTDSIFVDHQEDRPGRRGRVEARDAPQRYSVLDLSYSSSLRTQ
jgi:hypothetical protein